MGKKKLWSSIPHCHQRLSLDDLYAPLPIKEHQWILFDPQTAQLTSSQSPPRVSYQKIKLSHWQGSRTTSLLPTRVELLKREKDLPLAAQFQGLAHETFRLPYPLNQRKFHSSISVLITQDLDPKILQKQSSQSHLQSHLTQSVGGFILTTGAPLALYQKIGQITHLPSFYQLAYTHQVYAGPFLFIPAPHSGLLYFDSPTHSSLIASNPLFKSSLSSTQVIHTLSRLLSQGITLKKGDLITLLPSYSQWLPSAQLYTHQRPLIKRELLKHNQTLQTHPHSLGRIVHVQGGSLLGRQQIRFLLPQTNLY